MTTAQVGIIVAIVVYLFGMLIIGFISSKNTNDVGDFYLGGAWTFCYCDECRSI